MLIVQTAILTGLCCLQGCGCDDGTYNALVQALSDNLGFATTGKQLSLSCMSENSGMNWELFVVNFTNTDNNCRTVYMYRIVVSNTNEFLLLFPVMEKVRDQCAGQGTNFKVTLKGYIDSSGNEVCASDPLIECKDD